MFFWRAIYSDSWRHRGGTSPPLVGIRIAKPALGSFLRSASQMKRGKRLTFKLQNILIIEDRCDDVETANSQGDPTWVAGSLAYTY